MSEFCRLALEFTRSGAKKEVFARAAGSIGVQADEVASGVLGLSNVFKEAAKANLAKGEFLLSVSDLDLSDDAKNAIAEFYVGCVKEVQGLLAKLVMALPEYHHMDWRLDMELGSRMQRKVVEPKFVIRLDTREPELKSTYAEADFATLQRLIAELEAAEAEVKTAHSQRVARYIR